jgi:hypothetical protein
LKTLIPSLLAGACALASPISAQEVNSSYLSHNGWFSDDTRADGSGLLAAGTNLVSDTLTDDPEATATGTSAHNSDIFGQIAFGPAPGAVPALTHDGAVRLFIDASGSGKSQISHRKTDLSGHGPGSGFGPGFAAEYSWMGNGPAAITASLKFGIRTAEFGSAPVSSRTGENAWDKVLIYEPGNGNGAVSDGLWQTETIDHSTGAWWFFDRNAGASIIGSPMTLATMSTSPLVFSGSKTAADVYALITAPGAVITSVQFGIGSGNANGNVFVNQLTTNVYRSGMTTTFGRAEDFYANGFEEDTFGWNVFASPSFGTTRVPSGTSGVVSASGSWHAVAGTSAGNWGGYSAVSGCAAADCAGPVSEFPTGGYLTAVDVYLDVDGGFADDTRFDFSSAINNTSGAHRRDFIFNGAFLDASNLSGPGGGQNRFLFAASNNSPGFPQGGIDPVAITTSGWYTLEHFFYDSGAGVLACDFTIRDADGDALASWTRSNATDVIGSTVGGNRYGWFVTNEFPFLAFDNTRRAAGPFDQNVTPDLILGAGNANGSFTVAREDGVELGLRGKLRFPASNVFNSNGDGTYTFSTGSGTGAFPNSEWSFEWSVNTDYDDSTGRVVGDLSYEIGMDNDPSGAADYLVFDPISIGTVIPYTVPAGPIPFWDHSMGNNGTANGGGLEAADGVTYAGYLSTFNVAQNSWRPTFYQNTAPYVWNPNTPGHYQYYLAAFDGGEEVARTAITIVAVDGTTLTLEGEPCQTDQSLSTPGVQVAFELWLRNPDDVTVTGYQAFLAFDDSAMTYVGAASSYSPAPFNAHIQSIGTASVAPGELRLDGNTFGVGATGDALLATLVFTVTECDQNTLAFDLAQPFASEVSNLGSPYATALLDSSAVIGDVTAPLLVGTPADIVQPADAGSCTGAVVTFAAPTAVDNCDPAPSVVCVPASGSTFPVGTTVVTCTATDACGNESFSTFDVTVTATNAVDVIVHLVGSMPTSRCIRFVPDSCAALVDVPLTFVGSSPAVAVATIEIPCGVWTELCAKDEQHSQWDTVTMTVVGSKYVVDAPLELDGGDTDNDGDVDINDVTLFLSQFGDLATAGGCPWGGQRDADFDNGGAVGSEDYSFLVANWLTTSSCLCNLVGFEGGAERRRPETSIQVRDRASAAADLDGNGRVDVEDVELFERRHGFSGELSRRMRTVR